MIDAIWTKPCKGFRRVKIHSHQFYSEGYFHGYTKDGHGNQVAMIESSRDGTVYKYQVSGPNGVYSLQFVDPPEGATP